jgi:hypothetical protein
VQAQAQAQDQVQQLALQWALQWALQLALQRVQLSVLEMELALVVLPAWGLELLQAQTEAPVEVAGKPPVDRQGVAPVAHIAWVPSSAVACSCRSESPADRRQHRSQVARPSP